MLRFSAVGRSEVGLVRGNNEDSAFAGPSCLLVADGVGGGAAGEVASATTAYVVSATVMARNGEAPVPVLSDAVRLAQEQLAKGVLLDVDRAGMATTLTALATDGTTFVLAHLGDSRGYVFRDGELTRATHDHTWVQRQVDDGELDERDAADHPWRNVVLRSVSGEPAEEADVTPLDLWAGDRVLLASDGLTDLVDEARIAEVLARHGDDAATDHLIDAALASGGRDNVTCVLATVVEGPSISADGQILGAARDVHNIVDPAAVRSVRTA